MLIESLPSLDAVPARVHRLLDVAPLSDPVPEPTHDLLVPLLARADEVVVVDAEEGGRGAVLCRDPVAKLPV